MEQQEEINPRIRRARVDSLSLYEITEDELTTLEHGSPGSLYLIFSTFLITLAAAFLISLITTKIESIYTFIVFVVITVVGFFIGIILFCLWLREYRSSTSVAKKIRKRMQAETVNEEIKSEVVDPTSTLGDGSQQK